MTTEEMYNTLVDMSIATEEEIDLVTAINGDNEDAYEDILFVRTGYRSFEQLLED